MFTRKEVSTHNTDNDAWIIIRGDVYDVTDFKESHPGGKKVVMRYAGKDATEEFEMLHNKSILERYSRTLKRGELK